MGFSLVGTGAVDSNISDSQTVSKNSDKPFLPPSTAYDLKRLQYQTLDKFIASNNKYVEALDTLISINERQLKNVQDTCEDYCIKSTGLTRFTPETKTTFIVNLHNIRCLHPNDEQSTRVSYTRNYKWVISEGYRYLNLAHFEKYQLGTYEGATMDWDTPLLVGYRWSLLSSKFKKLQNMAQWQEKPTIGRQLVFETGLISTVLKDGLLMRIRTNICDQLFFL